MSKYSDVSAEVAKLLFVHCKDQADDPALGLLFKHYLRKHKTIGACRPRDRLAATMEAWESAEMRCFQTNRKLESLSDFSPLGVILHEARKKIESLIGSSPRASLFGKNGAFSGGATFSTKRGTHFSMKLKSLTITPTVWPFISAFRSLATDFEEVGGCKGCVVPKTALIDRFIAIEPSGNMFLQKIVGTYFRSRLKTVSIDLDDQTANQDGAFRAVVDDLATVDLEAASDGISIELVRWLLPTPWFECLNSLRSHRIKLLDGRWRLLNKFSSMGNGFTFELESLIFWALASCCTDGQVLVYGDDIIINRSDCDKLFLLFEQVGFVVNREKTFLEGPYFESCGKHYYNLEDVTPVFQKEPIADVWSAFRAHNRLVRWSQKDQTGVRRKVINAACRFLRKTFGFKDCAIPYGSERDDGWLTLGLPQRKDGDFDCIVLRAVTRSNNAVEDCFAYKYKLYNPKHENETCEGYVSNQNGSTETLSRKRVRVWRSSLET